MLKLTRLISNHSGYSVMTAADHAWSKGSYILQKYVSRKNILEKKLLLSSAVGAH